jgi:hypothetical protein
LHKGRIRTLLDRVTTAAVQACGASLGRPELAEVGNG